MYPWDIFHIPTGRREHRKNLEYEKAPYKMNNKNLARGLDDHSVCLTSGTGQSDFSTTNGQV